jgi:hypothetical protein
VTNEPTEIHEIATNEPKIAAKCVGGQRAELNAGADDRGQNGFEEGLKVKAIESIQRGCKKVRQARMESLRKLNEEARKEAELAAAVRRLRRPVPNNGKPGDRPKRGKTHAGQRKERGNAERDLHEIGSAIHHTGH